MLGGTRILFVGITIVAVAGGYLGLAQVDPSKSAVDQVYGTLQLFVLGNPIFDLPGVWPWYLNLARIAAPAVTAFAVFETGRLIVADQARRFRARAISGHTVVAGDTPFATAVVASLRATGTVVKHLSEAVDGDALREAGVGRASVLIACADHRDDPWVNLSIALDAAEIERDGRPLRIKAQVSDPAVAFTARSMGMTQAAKVGVSFFNIEEIGARAIAAGADRQDIAIVGLQEFGSALLLELARSWRKLRPGVPLNVTVVDERASARVAELKATHEVIAASCVLTAIDGEQIPAHSDLSRVYICYQDETKALRTALTAAAFWPAEEGGLVVRLDKLAGIGRAFDGNARLLDDLKGRLRVVSVVQLASAVMAGDDIDSDEHIARAIHERYLTQQLAAQVSMGARPSMTVWEELPEEIRDANRAQAAGIRAKLDQIGCTIGVRTPDVAEFSYRGNELEELSKLEHDRWSQDKIAAGWTYAPVRNDSAKQHDCLVPWSELSEVEREKDRDAVRNIPGILAEVGLQPVRLARRG
jgi:hypothetical protein